MGLRDLFTRNKNAKWLPDFLKDFRSTTVYNIENDITAQTCIDKIASAFATLSLGLYDKRNHNKVENASILEVLDEPNLDESHFQFFYSLIQDYFSGNVYLYKYYNKDGEVISLFRLNPAEVTVRREPNHNKKIYTYLGEEYDSRKILHIPSRFNYDGLIGKSIFSVYRKGFEVAADLDSYTQATFKNSAGKRLVVDINKVLPNATDEQKKLFRDKLVSSFNGDNVGKPLVKTGGVEYEVIDTGYNDERSQTLDKNRKFQQEVIAEIFNIPLEYLSGNVTNLENVTTMFMTNALQPIARAFEEAFTKLLPENQRERYFFEFNYASVLRTSLAQKVDAYSKELANAQLTINEIRRKENLAPIEAGDNLWIGSNLIPVTPDNVAAILANSKAKLQEVNTESPVDDSDKAGTYGNLNSARV